MNQFVNDITFDYSIVPCEFPFLYVLVKVFDCLPVLFVILGFLLIFLLVPAKITDRFGS